MSGDPLRAGLGARVRSTAYVSLNAQRQARFPFKDAAAIERAQRRRLRAMVEHARRHVPFYSEAMRKLGIAPGTIRTASDLAILPIVERHDLQRDPEAFLSRQPPPGGLLEHRTSGSSGEARSYWRDGSALVRDATHFNRLLSIAARAGSRRLGLRQASIVAPVSSARKAQAAYGARSLVPRWLGVHNVQLSLLDPVAHTVARLDEFRPDVIFTYGSFGELLLEQWRESDGRFHRPAAIIYSADHMSPAVRRELTDEHGILVLSAYQAVEAPQIGFECERRSGLHANIDLYPIRIVGSGGERVGPGAEGDVIVSNLVNRGTVLLNYRLGDRAGWLEAGCACGRELPTIALGEGRSEDWLLTKRGRRVHPHAVSMWPHTIDGVWRYQAVQESPGKLRFEVVPGPGADRTRLRAELEEGLRGNLGGEISCEVRFVDGLARTEAGKVPSVISTINRAASGAP